MSAPLVHQKINRKPVNTDSIEAMTPETDHLVYGSFLNVEAPGQNAKITCKYYKGQQLFCQLMDDGQYYTIPKSVARHINERCISETHRYLMDEKGQPLKTGKFTPRYKFIIERELPNKSKSTAA